MSERPLTERFPAEGAEPLDLGGYEGRGGYGALRKALGQMSPEQVIAEVRESNLRGRGGAGFPTGVKWGLVPKTSVPPLPVYLAVNADEMEPGTFKDRVLMEGDPHQLVEGTVIAAYAIGASDAFIFLRWAYKRSERLLRRAIAEARAAGYLGEDVLGTGRRIEVHLHSSAGRYICGEESALLTALEGKRALPRAKPPYPPVVGLWGKPTVVNNVETLCNVPHILARGASWFRDLGRSVDGGTKIYGASGRLRRPGAFELPLGATLGEVLEEHAGGLVEGRRLRGVQPGGASTEFLGAEHLDLPLDFQHCEQAGSRLGTGCLVVLDDRTCPVGMVLSLERFFARESCGFCTPCREGLPWVVLALAALEQGQGRPEDLEVLEEHVRELGPGRTFCALAPGAVAPLGSSLERFGDDYRRHLGARGCPYES